MELIFLVFIQLDHQNWFGMDDNLGPVAVSIKKERVNSAISDSPTQYRLIIRTSEVSYKLWYLKKDFGKKIKKILQFNSIIIR